MLLNIWKHFIQCGFFSACCLYGSLVLYGQCREVVKLCSEPKEERNLLSIFVALWESHAYIVSLSEGGYYFTHHLFRWEHSFRFDAYKDTWTRSVSLKTDQNFLSFYLIKSMLWSLIPLLSCLSYKRNNIPHVMLWNPVISVTQSIKGDLSGPASEGGV